MEHQSFVHNRRGVAAIAALIALALAGFGCGKQATPPGAATPIATSDGGPALPTQWSTYRNEAWGITIPYPEGWVVEEHPNGELVEYFDRQPPANSDMPSRVWVEVSSRDLEQVRRALPVIADSSNTERNGHSVLRVVHARDEDPAADESFRVAYIWTLGTNVITVDGVQGDPVLEEIVDRLTNAGGD